MTKKITCLSLLLFSFISLQAFAQLSVEDFMREPDYRSAALSPNGQYLAEVWNRHEDDTRIVTIKDLTQEGEPIIGMSADKLFRPNSVSWANNERLLILVDIPFETSKLNRLIAKGEEYDIHDFDMVPRLFAVNPDASKTVMLFEDMKEINKSPINFAQIRHFLPDDPEHVMLYGPKDNILSLYKVNVYDGSSELILKGMPNTRAFIMDESGAPLYRLDLKTTFREMQIHDVRDPKNPKFIEAIELVGDPDDGLEKGEVAGVLGSKLVYTKRNEQSGYQELWAYDGNTGEFETLASAPDQDILGILSSTYTAQAEAYIVDGDFLRYKYFDESKQQKYDQMAQNFPSTFRFLSSTEDGSKSIILNQERDNPGTFSFYNEPESTLTALPNSYFALPAEKLSIPAQATYKTRDGALVETYILLPNTYTEGEKYPMVVLPHGGPQARDRGMYDEFAQFISTRGYIVIQPNFRGSQGFGREFEEAGYKQWGGLMQDDVTDAVHFMVEQGFTDPERVCIAGISYGGYAALMGIIKTPELYQCAISINGVTDLPDIIDHSEGRNREKELIEKHLYARVGHPKNDKDMLIAMSPTHQAEKVAKPLLLMGSRHDETVPLKQALKMQKALNKNNKDFKYILLEESPHNPFTDRGDKEITLSEVENFLAKHLK